MGRPKNPSATLSSLDDANRVLYALLIAEVELEKQTGALDLARAAATAKYEKPIDAQKAAIADLKSQLQTWYMGNHSTLEKDGGKSIQLTFGIIGRRLGRPALKPLNRSWTWASIGIKLRSIYNARFFHAPADPDVDREKVRQGLNAEQLKECGLKVEQDETFFVETDRTTLGQAGSLKVAFLCIIGSWSILIAAVLALRALIRLIGWRP